MSSRSMPQHRPCIPLFPTWQGSAASIKCGAPRETTSQALVSYVFGRGVVATPIAFQLRGAIAGVNSFLMTSLASSPHAFLAELLNTAILSSQKESHSDVMNLSFAVQAPVSATRRWVEVFSVGGVACAASSVRVQFVACSRLFFDDTGRETFHNEKYRCAGLEC